MKLTSILAIYFLFFAASVFILLPFGVRTADEVGIEKVPGQAESAPHSFSLPRHLFKAALLSLLLFALYYANWAYGWITVEDLDLYN